MPRSIRVRQELIPRVKQAVTRSGFVRQKDVALELDLADSTIRNFLNGRPVDSTNFMEICRVLNLEWRDVADLGEPEGGILSEPVEKNSEQTGNCTTFTLPANLPSLKNWVPDSRSEELKDLKAQIFDPETKAISMTAVNIVGLPGIGKTTLACQLVHQLYEEKAPFTAAAWKSLQAPPGYPPPQFDSTIDEILEILSNGQISKAVTAKDDYLKKTERLVNLLQERPCLLVIDNVETVLEAGTSKKAGHFSDRDDCLKYGWLFKQLLVTQRKSTVIFTSREELTEVSNYLEKYRVNSIDQKLLHGLDLSSAVVLLASSEFQLVAAPNDLQKLAKRYQCHPQALIMVAALIRDEHFQGCVANFIEDKDYFLPQSLELLVDEIITRLSEKEQICLSRISVYRTQEYPLLIDAIAYQIQEESGRDIKLHTIPALERRQLLNYDAQRCFYQMHPLVQERALYLLDDLQGNRLAHQRAAEYYFKVSGDIEDEIQVKAAFEAFHHFYQIKDYQNCSQTLLDKILGYQNLENLRCSGNIWNYTTRIANLVEKIVEHLAGKQKAFTLIPLGVCYSDLGKNHQALKVSNQIVSIVEQIDSNTEDKELIFAKLVAHSISGRAYRLIGKVNQSIQEIEKSTALSNNYNFYQGKALALYELGRAFLDAEKPGRALRCFVVAAFQAIGINVVKEVYEISKLLFSPIETLAPKLEEIIQKYEPQENRSNNIKKFRIIYSIAQCFNSMDWYGFAEYFSKKSLIIAEKTDKSCTTWAYLELAICYWGIGTDEQAMSYYERAERNLENEDETFVIVSVLTEVGFYFYEKSRYNESLKRFAKVEKYYIKNTDFLYLHSRVFYGMSLNYEKLEDFALAREYCVRALEIAEELDLRLAKEYRALMLRLVPNYLE